jgi:hypothetical protein
MKLSLMIEAKNVAKIGSLILRKSILEYFLLELKQPRELVGTLRHSGR